MFFSSYVLIVIAQITTKNAIKAEYIIGGWNVGTPGDFEELYSPLLGLYLTEAVGSLYTPPLTFKVNPVDYSPESAAKKLIDSGLVDFICKRANISDFFSMS